MKFSMFICAMLVSFNVFASEAIDKVETLSAISKRSVNVVDYEKVKPYELSYKVTKTEKNKVEVVSNNTLRINDGEPIEIKAVKLVPYVVKPSRDYVSSMQNQDYIETGTSLVGYVKQDVEAVLFVYDLKNIAIVDLAKICDGNDACSHDPVLKREEIKEVKKLPYGRTMELFSWKVKKSLNDVENVTYKVEVKVSEIVKPIITFE